MGTGITDVIGIPHDFLPPRPDRSDEFPKLWYMYIERKYIIYVEKGALYELSGMFRSYCKYILFLSTMYI